MIKVLSIDGGGIRGLIPAMVLAKIEEMAGKQIAEMFHLIAGTSTGGILALALAKPGPGGKPEHSAAKLVDLYAKEGGRIFSRNVWNRIRAMAGEEEKYPADGLEAVLQQYFGEATLQEAVTEVVITSYEIERRIPFFFKSRHAKDATKRGYNFLMRHVARATSAAPTYFEPAKLADSADPANYWALVDGGVFANNPALCGYVEAKTVHPTAEDFLVVSLGTGELTRRLPYEEVKGWGLLRWAQPILNVVFDGVSDSVNYQLQHLLRPAGGKDRYYRFQVRLNEGNDDLDDAGSTNLRVLRLLAEDLIQKNQTTLRDLCQQLTEDP